MVVGQVYSDQLKQDHEQEFELQDLELGSELQELVPDFDLQDPELVLNCRTLSWILYSGTLYLICGTLYHIHKLILSIWIRWIRGIWSIHPDLNISEHFPYLKCANLPYMYTNLYPSLQVKSTQ